MSALDFRFRVSLQGRVAGRDALNAPINQWQEITPLWADIEPLSGHELVIARAKYAEATHGVTIRYQAKYANPIAVSKLRIVFGARVFSILASLDVGMEHRYLNLTCSEGLNDG